MVPDLWISGGDGGSGVLVANGDDTVTLCCSLCDYIHLNTDYWVLRKNDVYIYSQLPSTK